MAPRWKESYGEHGHRVTVSERADRRGRLVLTWYDDGKAKTEHLPKGTSPHEARSLAVQKAHLLAGGPQGITLEETEARLFDPKHGKYPGVSSAHHVEVQRCLRYAVRVWGQRRTWSSITQADYRALWREKIRELHTAGFTGARGAEVLVQRVSGIAHWLQDEGLIPKTAADPGRRWKHGLKEDWRQLTGSRQDPTPKRPRHEAADITKVIEAAKQVDPRFYLMLQLGAELRLGQVAQLKRSHVCWVPSPVNQNAVIEVPGTGAKAGVRLYLTDAQEEALVRALTGYLAEAEKKYLADGTDYYLFPGRLKGRPLTRTAWKFWFREAEKLAGIRHVRGRGPYGLRRAAVDGAKAQGIDRDALKELGGWKDTQMPDRVYASAEQVEAGKRARDIRAKVRKL